MASPKDTIADADLTNYVSYQNPQTGKPAIGHYDLTNNTIQPLSFISGTPINTLYQVIEVGQHNIIPSGKPISASSTKILPPLTGRDILCVGKNYAEHAKEFNSSGFDSSDKVDQPSHPVIFTKRFTSIIADGEDILPHIDFTKTLDYEGEIGVIIGKPGFRIDEKDAMDYVWGYTIVNDVTAREKQRDHKQFFLGKSADTFCPMGPIAVPAAHLPKELRVQTHVNSELRQNATTKDLIFSIPYLIKTISEGQTLVPGDVLATGTPAGVGIGRKPPIYLNPGDTISVSVSGLGTLTNRIASPDAQNPTLDLLPQPSHLDASNTSKTPSSPTLTTINKKPLYYKALGQNSNSPIIFIHGLGATSEYFLPLISTLKLDSSHTCHLFDLEGHGLSPTHPLSTLSISSFASDVDAIFAHANITSPATIVAHNIGCLIALAFAQSHPSKVSKLILIGPLPSPLPDVAIQATLTHAQTVRTHGLSAIVDGISTFSTSAKTKSSNPLALAAVRMSLLSQDPEGYAKACTALATAIDKIDAGNVKARTLIVTGSEDKTSPPQLCEEYASSIGGDVKVEVLRDVGHWHVFEDLEGVSVAVDGFLKR